MSEIKIPSKQYYCLCPEDNAQEFLDLFMDLYPNQHVHLAAGIFIPLTPEGNPQDETKLETFRVIIRDKIP